MVRIFKQLVSAAALLLAGLSTAGAFSLLGPGNEAYQVPEIDYMLAFDVGAPKNLGEEYRWNVPVLYYSYDAAFLDFFGSNGVVAVDQAFSILNNDLFRTNVSNYSPDLSEFPLSVRRQNITARALSLVDLKSAALQYLIEELGLADPTRYVWCLHDRFHVGTVACPVGMEYLVITRNFGITPSDPTTLQSSPYVNTVFYTYTIQETCNPPNPLTYIAPTFPDPYYASRYAPVAAGDEFPMYVGDYLTGFSRDDAAGIRYLLSSTNVNYEATPTNSILYLTNTAPSSLQLLSTSNLTQFAADVATNNPATLLGLYPNLLIDAAVPYFTNVTSTNVTYYYTNFPWDVAGAAASLAAATNYSTNVATYYRYAFANVVSNFLMFPNGYVFTNNLQVFTNGRPFTNTLVTVIETNIGTPAGPWVPYGVGGTGTNITTYTMRTNMLVGDYFILPTNACGILLLSNVLSQTVAVTNTLISASNNPATGGTGTNFQFFSRTVIYYYTNHYFAYFPVDCVPASVGLRRGIERMQFVRRDYDSLLGRFFEPVTNFYSMVTVTNSTNWVQAFRREVPVPDILMTAQDMASGPAAGPLNLYAFRTVPHYNQTYKPANLAGPGTLEPSFSIGMNKVGLVYENNSPFIAQGNTLAGFTWTWASFDNSTNAPVVYPNGTSIADLESQLILQITTPTLPSAQVGAAYSADLSGTGGQPPYTWSLAPSSSGLPDGLAVQFDGTIVGTPADGSEGVYDVIIRLTDMGARYVERYFTLTVTKR